MKLGITSLRKQGVSAGPQLPVHVHAHLPAITQPLLVMEVTQCTGYEHWVKIASTTSSTTTALFLHSSWGAGGPLPEHMLWCHVTGSLSHTGEGSQAHAHPQALHEGCSLPQEPPKTWAGTSPESCLPQGARRKSASLPASHGGLASSLAFVLM